MKIIDKESNSFNLNKSNFLASGGEADIHVVDNVAFKIYHDSENVIPEEKIEELSSLNQSNIINPISPVYFEGKCAGYSMEYVKDTVPLCKIFTKAFKKRNNIDNNTILNLIKSMINIISFIHSKDIIIVDLNEMNFLVDNTFSNVYFIDVDSYQTKNHKAKVLMESVRDRHAKEFSKSSDWFSFGILAFQMLIGIHPYKGRHGKYKTLDERMLNNISVFNNGVKVPKICSSFDVIPNELRNWFEEIFDQGKRTPPPAIDERVVSIKTEDIIEEKDFYLSKLKSFNQEIKDAFSIRDFLIVRTKDKIFINDTPYDAEGDLVTLTSRNRLIEFVIKNNKLISRWIKKDGFVNLNLNIQADSIMRYDERVYIKSGTQLIELSLIDLPNKIMISPSVVGNVLKYATKLYDGVVVQNILGSYYFSVFDSSKENNQFCVPELTGYKVIDAKYRDKVLIVIGENASKYYRFTVKVDDLQVGKEEDIVLEGIKLAVLSNGVAMTSSCKGVTLFCKNNTMSRYINSDEIANMEIFLKSDKIYSYNDHNIYSLTSKK